MDEAWLVDAAAWAAVEPYRAAPGAVVADTGTLRWYRTPIDYQGLNGVLWARLPEAGLEAAVERALAPFRETGVPMEWHLGPTSSPPSLSRALAAAGLSRQEEEPGMVADLAALGPPPPAPAGLEVRRVAGEDDLAAWCRVWAGLAPGTDVGGLVEVRTPKALGADPPVPHLLAVLDGPRWAARPSWSGTGGAAGRRRPGSRTWSRRPACGGAGSARPSPGRAWTWPGRGGWTGPP